MIVVQDENTTLTTCTGIPVMDSNKLDLILKKVDSHPKLQASLTFVGNYLKHNNIKLNAEADDSEFRELSNMVTYIQFDLKVPLNRDERDKNEFLRTLALKYVNKS